jgi:hypothetical protein
MSLPIHFFWRANRIVDDVVILVPKYRNHVKAPGSHILQRLRSMLEVRAESMLGLMELLELRRLLARWSFGLRGWRPD